MALAQATEDLPPAEVRRERFGELVQIDAAITDGSRIVASPVLALLSTTRPAD